MAIIKTDSIEVGYKLIGTYVTPRIHSYMSLYCVAKGTSKSKIFKELFLEWVSKQKEKESESKLVRMLIERTQKAWLKSGVQDLDKFKGDVERELTSKNIAPNYIALILSEIV